ncbi:MAG TPA: hypothetical protein VFS30_16855 [Dehalococcoidia bacterium]|nr:hypothetical protein [Dehalococcoidia bacterium]
MMVTPRAPSPSPRASSTPTPTPVTQASPTLPTVTATPRPDGLQFHFGPGVSDFDRSLITRAVEVTSELLSAGAEVRPPSAVFAYSSPAQLESAFDDRSLAQTWRSQGMARRMALQVAEASYRGIVINTGSAGWLELDATQRLRAVAHEYVHVIQLERAGQEVADSTLLGPTDQTPATGPFWLLEGAAEVVSWLVLQELNLGSYNDSLFEYAADAGESEATLEELSSFIGYRAAGSEGLGLAVLATDYLLRSRSLDALFDFWGGTSLDAPWTASFARHFGLPVDFFYLAFATYYENTWEGFTP